MPLLLLRSDPSFRFDHADIDHQFPQMARDSLFPKDLFGLSARGVYMLATTVMNG